MTERTPKETGWLSPEESDAVAAQARELRDQARAGGLRFEVYLPPGVAEWLLGLVGAFTGPSEAAWVMIQEAMELESHADLRRELLQRKITASINDPRPWVSGEELMQRLTAELDEPRPAPAQWHKPGKIDP